ncbi:MAG: response regulator [Faecalibacterium sp.]|jgi:two-component system response regulator YesN|nr:response regulator [Faecalibacterium sp.]
MSYSVLLADDEPLTLDYLKKVIPVLNPAFSRVVCAQNGKEALALLRQGQYDLVITDIRMPETDGLTLAKIIRQENLCAKVVILSGFDEFAYAQQAIRYNVQDYLLKPIEKQKMSELLAGVQRDLERLRRAKEEQRVLQSHVSAYQNNLAAERLNQLIALRSGTPSFVENGEEGFPLFGMQNVVLCFGYDAMSLVHKCTGIRDLDLYDYVLYQLLRDMSREHAPEHVWFFGKGPFGLLCTAQSEVLPSAQHIAQQLSGLLQSTAGLHLHTAISSVFACEQEFAQAVAEAQRSLSEEQGLPSAAGREDPIAELSLRNTILSCAEAQSRSRLKALLVHYLEGVKNEPVSQAAAALRLLYPRDKLLYRYSVSEAAYAASLAALLAALAVPDGTSTEDVLCRCLLMLFDAKPLPEAGNMEMAEKAKKFIDENYAQPISLLDTADQLHVTPNYLSAVFHGTTGESYIKYLTRIRMQHAAALLREDSLKIADIAEQCGYFSIKNFFRVFKATYGQTPNEFRLAKNSSQP